MKEELIKYVMERADKCYQDDFPISRIESWIREFFDQYQPERSKREDLLEKLINAHQDVEFIVENCPCDVCIKISKMRCSEHCGNTVREVQ